MSEINETGSILEKHVEVHVEWQIPDASVSLFDATAFKSPVFSLPDSCWRLVIYPKSDTNPDCIGMFLSRMDHGTEKSVKMSLGIKKADGVEDRGSINLTLPDKNKKSAKIGLSRFITKIELLKRNSLLMPKNVLTITCTLTSAAPQSTEVSLINRLWNLSQNLRTILDEKSGSDFIIKVRGNEFSAHRIILENRCDFFATMLGNEFQENEKGVAEIDDIEKDVFQCILTYLYTGEVEGISSENVGKIYIAADKLLLVELKKFCIHYMKENLNDALIYDAIAIAVQYVELELEKRTFDYFTEHADEIFKSVGWEKFKIEKEALVTNFLEKIIAERY